MADPLLNIEQLTFPSLDDAGAVAREILAALRDFPMVCVKGQDYSPAMFERWKEIVRLLGEPAAGGEDGATGRKDGSVWMDVRYDEARAHTFRHSATAQPLHTDSAYNPEPVDLVFFLCQHQAAQGGETIFVSAETVDQAAYACDPALHAQLRALPLPYGKAEHRGRSAPVLEDGANGLAINWNYYRVLEDTSEVAGFRQRFFDFLQKEIVDRGKVTAHALAPGEVVLFRDQKMLHGRRGFTPSPRCIWKCGLNRRA